jgi:hypothetical protein
MMIIFQNCGDEDITSPRCSKIRFIEILKNPYFDEISKVKTNEWKLSLSKPKSSRT